MSEINKMATNLEVKNKIGCNLPPNSKCPTRQEIESTGKGKVDSTYRLTQLVPLRVVNKSKETVTIYFSGSDTMGIRWQSTLPLASSLEAMVHFTDTDQGIRKTSSTLSKGSRSGSWSAGYHVDRIAIVRINPNEDSLYHYSGEIDDSPA